MSREDHEQTRRHFDVVAQGLRSDMRFLAEGLAMTNETLDRFREDTAREFADAHSELNTFREATARNFADARAELATFKAETARNFADVRAELRTSHSEVDGRLSAVESR
jgi:hypothetical protein